MRWDFPKSRIRPIESTIRISENYLGSLPEAVMVQAFFDHDAAVWASGIFSAFIIICIF